MPLRTLVLCTLFVAGLIGCRQDTDEELAAERAPGKTSGVTASTEPVVGAGGVIAGSRGTSASAPAGSQSGTANGASAQQTPEQQRVGPTPSQLSLDPALPPDAVRAKSSTGPHVVSSEASPTEEQRVTETEARASCNRLAGSPKDECLRNVQRGFDRADPAAQGSTTASDMDAEVPQPPARGGN